MTALTDWECFEQRTRDFCAVIDQAGPRDTGVRLEKVLHALVAVYQQALQLPWPALDGIEVRLNSEPDWVEIQARLSKELGQRDAYQLVFDPCSPAPEEAIYTVLSDDLAHIYRDLMRGLLALGKGGDNHVHWEWKLSFETHWGQHAVSAMTALHSLLWGPSGVAE